MVVAGLPSGELAAKGEFYRGRRRRATRGSVRANEWPGDAGRAGRLRAAVYIALKRCANVRLTSASRRRA